MYLIYNLTFTLLFVITFPYFFIRGVIGKHGVSQRLGFLPSQLKSGTDSKKPIWIHAASVGEVKLIPILVDTLLKGDSSLSFIVTTTTKTGQGEARKLLSERVTRIFYQPVDLPWVTDKVMRLLMPSALLLVETEFWPNLIRSAKKAGAVIGQINGRISSRSFNRYSLVRPLARRVLSELDFFAVQTEKDLHRLNALGAQIHKMRIVGSLKFEQKLQVKSKPRRINKRELGIPEEKRIFVAGSTRPGEEEIVLKVYQKLCQQDHLILILAPRHLDRISEIELLLQQMNLKYSRRSQIRQNSLTGLEVLLLDTMGELADIYSLADLAFVGGSLVPLGGHNPLEPAVFGVPVLFGPYMEHSLEAAELLLHSGLGFKVKDEEEFVRQAQLILSNGLNTAQLYADFQRALGEKTGAAGRTAEIIFRHLAMPKG
jgi:3-deoxy-D-manno-octulosonic-acid transferase